MKSLIYKWHDDIWLLHVEANNTDGSTKSITYSRIIDGSDDVERQVFAIKPGESYRFIVSRKHENESGVNIVFSEGIVPKIYRLRDRAYVPGSSDEVVF